jgi:hypothetical protein
MLLRLFCLTICNRCSITTRSRRKSGLEVYPGAEDRMERKARRGKTMDPERQTRLCGDAA